jgi:molybdenum cofactor biosynthesis enzyme MoaA
VPNQKIFCNSPWYELHIYWDGSLGICCQEDHKLYSSGEQYNIARMSIADWFNSEPAQNFRRQILGDVPVSACRRCWVQEEVGGNSRRIKSNQKSAIFRQAFSESFEQSPGRKHFDTSGITSTHPVDIHVDLGNYCNLACKMCIPQASSVIASQQVKWGIESSRQYLGTDWTKDTTVWNSFLQQLLDIPGLNNIHLMGGETLLTNRFEELVDHMIAHNRFDVCFSFVTNGTIFKPDLMKKLLKFRRVGIEVSIEAVDDHNTYLRQGTNTAQVLENIEQYRLWCNGSSITVTVRPSVSGLTIGYLPDLLQYCLDKQLVVKSLIVSEPAFLNPTILPLETKHEYLKKYQTLSQLLSEVQVATDYNASNPTNYVMIVKEHIEMYMNILSTATPNNVQQHHKELAMHCQKWDKIYGYDARELYPELSMIWDQYGY